VIHLSSRRVRCSRRFDSVAIRNYVKRIGERNREADKESITYLPRHDSALKIFQLDFPFSLQRANQTEARGWKLSSSFALEISALRFCAPFACITMKKNSLGSPKWEEADQRISNKTETDKITAQHEHAVNSVFESIRGLFESAAQAVYLVRVSINNKRILVSVLTPSASLFC
jgi:hypothetical protein